MSRQSWVLSKEIDARKTRLADWKFRIMNFELKGYSRRLRDFPACPPGGQYRRATIPKTPVYCL
jgi:hypothetical protein